jgi:anti-anti-sigma factor
MLGTFNAIGEIDLFTAPSFSAGIHDAIDGCDNALVAVDCSGVTFMDSSGYDVLVDATEYAERHGRTLVVRNASRPCARLFQIFAHEGELRFDR